MNARLRLTGRLPAHDPDESEIQAATDSATVGPPDVTAADFAESQLAGLAAALSFSKAQASADPPFTEKPHLRTPARPASPHREAASSAPARPAQVIALSAPEIDRPTADDGPAPMTLDRLTAAGTQPSRARGAAWSVRDLVHIQLPLLIVILTIQAVLSLRLVWSNTAFLDEAIYLSAGHAEIAHWLHGTPIPAYATYFSGAPVIYPPIGAIADSLGGLAAARILSLLFMLGTTSLLWSMTSKLFGGRAAVSAATLFAVLGPTLQLGAFATFDAMALFLLAASACCMVFARDRDDSTLLLVAGTVLLVLANAAKYSTAIFDPSVIAIAGLTVAGKRGVKSAVARSGYIAAGAIGLISALLALGGPWYLAGALYTTVSRAAGTSPPLQVFADAWKWVGLVCVIAGVGVILCALRRRDRVQVMLLMVLAASGILAPLNQARIHTATSLSKHVDFGAWFAAAAAGYAIAQLSQIGPRRVVRFAVAGLVLIAAALPAEIMGRAQASEIFHEWPNSARLTADLRSLTRVYQGHYLAEDYDVPAYYLESDIFWQRWSGTGYFNYTPPGTARPLTGPAAYRAAINRHYFSLVILNFEDTSQIDGEIIADMQGAGDYQVIAVVPSSIGQYTIWAYTLPRQPGSRHGNR